MTVYVTLQTVEPTPTAVVQASTTWPAFAQTWRPMLDQVWAFLRGGAPKGLYNRGHNVMFYKDDVPNVEVGVQVTGSFEPVGDVVASTLPGGLVANATHTGPIAKIGETHRSVREWSGTNGHRLAGPRWGGVRRSRPVHRRLHGRGLLASAGRQPSLTDPSTPDRGVGGGRPPRRGDRELDARRPTAADARSPATR